MTKSTITRERLEQLADNNTICKVSWDERIELAQIALAAMDSEPVAEVVSIYGDPEAFGEREIRPLVGIQQMPYGTKLYRHAQPAPVAPVVPEEATSDSIEILASARRRDHAVFQWDEDQRNAAADSWNAFRAAMLQAAPLTNEGDIQAGNSPAQSGCCPAQSQIDHGYRPECECSGCKATARICAELSANSSANPDCWCRTCRPVDLNDMRFVVCPDCGNKRCPRANDHRNACTGSNEPGQEGSAYPDTPQEVKGE